MNNGTTFGPNTDDWHYDLPLDLASNILSGAQRLPNGNTLICSGRNGKYIEIDEDNTIVWKYVTPISIAGFITQGDSDQPQFIFNARRYNPDFTGLVGKDLTPGPKLELNPINNCVIHDNAAAVKKEIGFNFEIFPNPVHDGDFRLEVAEEVYDVLILDITGKIVYKNYKLNEPILTINGDNFEQGIYIVKVIVNGQTNSRPFIIM